MLYAVYTEQTGNAQGSDFFLDFLSSLQKVAVSLRRKWCNEQVFSCLRKGKQVRNLCRRAAVKFR